MLCQHIVIGDAVILHRSGVLYRVGRVDAVHVLGQQNHVGVDLRRPQHRRRIGGEERITGTAAKNNHASIPVRGGHVHRFHKVVPHFAIDSISVIRAIQQDLDNTSLWSIDFLVNNRSIFSHW